MPSISVPSVKGETHLGFSISRNLAKIYEANYDFMCVGILVRFIGWSAGKGEQSQVATIQLISSAWFVQQQKGAQLLLLLVCNKDFPDLQS